MMRGPTDGAVAAAALMRERGLHRVMDRARDVFRRNNGPRGSVVLADATDTETAGIASLLGRPISASGPLRVGLQDIDAQLRDSRFSCSLEDTLAAFHGQPIVTRSQERTNVAQRRQQQESQVREAIMAVLGGLPSDTLGRRWLEKGAHGAPWLVEQYRPLSEHDLLSKVSSVRRVLHALNNLPDATTERLPAFANRCLGNPHALDLDKEEGRLFVRVLLDLYGQALGIPTERSSDALSAEERRGLYEYVNIVHDSISPTVTVHNLAGAIRRDGTPDPLFSALGPRVLVLPLRQVMAWQSIQVARRVIFVVENPSVFEDIVDALESEGGAEQQAPTIVCTAGWLNTAAWRLFGGILAHDPSSRFFYSGDIDLAGLQIAESLRQRYPASARPWRMDVETYRLALGHSDTGIPAEKIPLLERLPAGFADLIAEMRSAQQWAYQESITSLLIKDVRAMMRTGYRGQ